MLDLFKNLTLPAIAASLLGCVLVFGCTSGGDEGSVATAGASGAGIAGNQGAGGAGAADGGGPNASAGHSSTSGSPSVGGASSGGVDSGGGGSGLGGSTGYSGSAGSGGTAGNSGAAGNGGATTSTGSGGSSGVFSVCTGTPSQVVNVYTIGDSTMSIYSADLYPRMGWGQPLGDLFGKRCAVVLDKALSGRSSKSFYDEGHWTPIKSALKSGDYVLIEFAHNDEKSDQANLYTDPQTTYKQYLTTYITDTRAKGATPILLTPINRNSWNGTTLADTHGAYPPAMRELAAALSVDLVDLTALTRSYFERIGQTETTKLFMDLAPGSFPNYPQGNTDNTHLQEPGARIIGRLAMSDAYAQRLKLASLLTAIPVAP